MAVSTPHGSHQAEFEKMRQNVWKKMFVNRCPGHWCVHKIKTLLNAIAFVGIRYKATQFENLVEVHKSR